MKLLKLHKFFSIFLILLVVLIVFCLVQFGLVEKGKSKKDISSNYNIVLIKYPDENKTYSEILENALKTSSEKLGLDCNVMSTEDYNNSYEDTLDAALLINPTLIILPDDTFADAVYSRQFNTESNFLMINSIPHNPDSSDETINDNVLSLMFDESDSGFTAGYISAVQGFKQMEFLCDVNDTNSVKYCYGFLQGANYAAEENNLKDIMVYVTNLDFSDNNISYVPKKDCDGYVVTSDQTLDLIDFKNSNIESDTPIIYCNSYKASGKVKLAVATNVSNTLCQVIDEFYSDKINGGTTYYADAFEGNVSVDYDKDVFNNISDKEIDNVLTQINLNKINIISDTTIKYSELDLENITVK